MNSKREIDEGGTLVATSPSPNFGHRVNVGGSLRIFKKLGELGVAFWQTRKLEFFMADAMASLG